MSFHGLSAEGALGLAQKTFPASVAEVSSALDLKAGGHVLRYLSPTRAVVRVNGRTLVAVSNAPVATSAGGHWQAVNLALRSAPGGYSAVNSAERPFMAATAVGGVGLGNVGVSMKPLFGGSASGRAVQGSVFYPNVARDTDLIAKPIAVGLETMLQIRSAASPTAYTFALHVPAGDTFRLQGSSGQRSVAIFHGSRQVALIPAPEAFDATHVAVPASYSLSGDRLTVHVSLRTGAPHWPVLVDPVVDGWNWWYNGPPSDFTGWNFNTTAPSNEWGACGCSGFDGLGLYQNSAPNYTYGANQYGKWSWTAPQGSYIYEADFTTDFEPATTGACITQYVEDSRSGVLGYYWRNPNFPNDPTQSGYDLHWDCSQQPLAYNTGVDPV
jgi:hypothetical protein